MNLNSSAHNAKAIKGQAKKHHLPILYPHPLAKNNLLLQLATQYMTSMTIV